MNFKRIGRLLVCLVLICALLINVSPIKAKADVVSGAIVVGGAVVSVPVAIAIGATLICLGIIADAASQNPYALQKLASDVGDALSAAGTYVKDGMVEMYRFVTDTGEAVYYAAADFMNAVHSSVFDIGAVTATETFAFPGYDSPAISEAYAETMAYPFHCVAYNQTNKSWYFIGSEGYIDVIAKEGGGYWIGSATEYCYTYQLSTTTCVKGYIKAGSRTGTFVNITAAGLTTDYICTEGLTLAALLTGVIDGTSARAWSETYANRGLYVATGGNQGDPDDGAEGNDGWKFLLPLTLGSAAILAAMSQSEQWTGTTPPEFDDYTEKEELTVTPAPEFDGYQAIEIAPVTNPNPDPNPDPGPGTGSDPDAGGDSAESTWWQRLYQWLLEIKTSINELPNKFDEHFENLNNNIQEVPNKFESWIQNILSAIAAVPQAIVSGIKNVLTELFVPDSEYLSNKIQGLVQKFGYLEPIISLGDTFKVYLTGVNPSPPVIWIDLGASAWYPLGGRVKFIDLTWYAQYKPTVDGIMGAFLWLWFLWRLLQAAPGIIQGSSGFFGNPDPHPDSSFNAPNWPTGQRLLQSGSFYHFRGSGDKQKFNE